MRIALAQMNSVLGDFKGNRLKMMGFIQSSLDKRCDLVIFPEASLFGYHPVDLLERVSVVNEQLKELKQLHRSLPKGIAVIIGAITKNSSLRGKPYFNSAVFLERGRTPKVFPKQLLPTYDVFDEGRHIEPGEVRKNILRWKGKNILVTICEDIWAWPAVTPKWRSIYSDNPLLEIKPKQVDLIINLSASPFTVNKFKMRRKVVGEVWRRFKKPVVYVNMVGGQDELIFDGRSFALDKKGKMVAQSAGFEEDLNVVDLERNKGGLRQSDEDINELRRRALALGIRDFIEKTGLKKVHLGLSGGIDSALVACLAVDALGPHNVTALSLPGPFTSEKSRQWAVELAGNLGLEFKELSINKAYETVLEALTGAFDSLEFGLLHENLQARLRAIFLMAFSNKENSLLLNTSNKSEMATGYTTLYGDLCGGLCPLGDLLKTQVFELARHYNREYELIPEGIISRPPSAELRAGQKDQDTLPPYKDLDRAVSELVEHFRPVKTKIENWVLQALMQSEFKRWQAPPILKISDHAFGRGRRLPLAHRARV